MRAQIWWSGGCLLFACRTFLCHCSFTYGIGMNLSVVEAQQTEQYYREGCVNVVFWYGVVVYSYALCYHHRKEIIMMDKDTVAVAHY